MWPFKSVENLKESGLLQGATDWHSHILPGVDDGIRTLEDSLDVLREYDSLGIKRVWLTPHIMEDYPNATAELKERFRELESVWTGNVELRLAAENMLDSLFEERIEKGDLLPIGDDGRHLLVETSYYTPPMGMEDMIDKIKSKGFYPVLAHPERYRYMTEEDYLKWKEKDVVFQMNLVSLVGGYGETAQKKAEWLLSKGMVDLFGSDLHNLGAFRNFIDKSPRKRAHLNNIKDLAEGKNIL